MNDRQARAATALSAADYLARYETRTPGSKALYAKACQSIPGGVSHNPRHHAPYPIFFAKAKGCRLEDVDGNEYIDLWMAHYDALLGHALPEVVALLQETTAAGFHVGLSMAYEVELAEKVIAAVPAAEQVRFCSSGTEATMYAVRLARGFTGKSTILKIKGGWHGANTDLMVDVKPPEYIGLEGAGLLPGLDRYTRAVEFNDIEDTARAIAEAGDDWAGIILEPAMGAGGFIPAELEYLDFLREETRKAGAVLIFDEIITGFRLALGGAQEMYGITPDMVTLGKVMGGGMAIGAVAGREDIMALSSVERKGPKASQVIIGGGTYSTNPLSMVAALATLGRLEKEREKIYPIIAQRAATLGKGIQDAFAKVNIPVCLTGAESLLEVHFLTAPGLPVRNMRDVIAHTDAEKKHEMCARLRNHGVFIFHSGAVSYAHQDADIQSLIAAHQTCAQEMAEGQ